MPRRVDLLSCERALLFIPSIPVWLAALLFGPFLPASLPLAGAVACAQGRRGTHGAACLQDGSQVKPLPPCPDDVSPESRRVLPTRRGRRVWFSISWTRVGPGQGGAVLLLRSARATSCSKRASMCLALVVSFGARLGDFSSKADHVVPFLTHTPGRRKLRRGQG